MSRLIKDLIGERFGRLVVIELTNKRIGTYVVWKCKCDCGNICEVTSCNLLREGTKSCGCLKRDVMRYKDLTGKRFGRLVVLERANIKNVAWKCLCDCGKESYVLSSALLKGATRSCGCLKIELTKLRQKIEYGQAAFNRVYGGYKSGARERNIEFNLSLEDFTALTKQNCFYCGVEPRQIEPSNNGIYIYNGIDRVNNNEGYKLNNCVPCCGICNKAKRDLSLEEFYSWIDRLTENKKNRV